MIRCKVWIALLMLSCGSFCLGQGKNVAFPDTLVIAQVSYFDIGPPFDYYELIKLTPSSDGVSIEKVLITPEGQACLQPAKVETHRSTLRKTLPELLGGKNPCAIPDKQLDREIKRRKKGSVFSGVNVTMQAHCGSGDRIIRMDILDRDLFDTRANTPENTSWTMRLLSELDGANGQPGMDKPIFPTGEEKTKNVEPETETVKALFWGSYDELFGKSEQISEVVKEAEEPPPPPATMELVSSTPMLPITPVLPRYYPPIAKVVRIEGSVTIKFDIDSSGKAQNIRALSGPEMLRSGVTDAVGQWLFPEAAFGKPGEATMKFKLNCYPTVRTSVN